VRVELLLEKKISIVEFLAVSQYKTRVETTTRP